MPDEDRMNAGIDKLTYRFTTAHAPPGERFDAWCAEGSALFDMHSLADAPVPYDSSFDFTLLDQVMFGGREWAHPSHAAVHAMSRSAKRIRKDGLDNYYLRLQISEHFNGYAGTHAVDVGPGELCLLDMASPFELQVTTGDTICVVVPRELLPADAAHLHGRSLKGGMNGILADYLRSMRRSLRGLTPVEMPCAVHATRNMLQACLSPTPETIAQAATELDAFKVKQIVGYIDQHLLCPELDLNRICKDVGISRSKLYRLFEPKGGVMRMIQHKRLLRARYALTRSLAPRRMRIADVAWQHGFVSEKHFSRLFKETFGCTPSEVAAQGLQETRQSAATAAAPETADQSNFGAWVRQFAAY